MVVLGEHREAVQHQHPQSVSSKKKKEFQKTVFQWRRCVPTRTSTAPAAAVMGGIGRYSFHAWL